MIKINPNIIKRLDNNETNLEVIVSTINQIIDNMNKTNSPNTALAMSGFILETEDKKK